jgi:hypothetical protein
MYINTKVAAIVAISTLGACSMEKENPGAFAGALPAVNVEGHDVTFAVAHTWMNTCLDDTPANPMTTVAVFEHNHGDKYLTNHGVQSAIAANDCAAVLKALTALGGAGLMADGIRDGADTINATAILENEIEVISTVIN